MWPWLLWDAVVLSELLCFLGAGASGRRQGLIMLHNGTVA
jgi:hypothetical protein